jgi:hypothetical protein
MFVPKDMVLYLTYKKRDLLRDYFLYEKQDDLTLISIDSYKE